MNREIELESSVKEILNALHSKGKGYVVGGYVRDKLLNLTPEDCDFVTDLHYETVREIFKNFCPKEFGKQFGILEIKYKEKHYEIARYRIDIGTPQDRKLQEVVFTENIQEDLKRRDFTINSIAFDGEKFISVPQAFQDLENRIIRFNGIPEERIKEDPLRILRGIRFAITKNFELDSPEVYKDNMKLIKQLSAERIRDEFIKILLSSNVAKGIELLWKLGGMSYIISEFTNFDFSALLLKDHESRKKVFSVLEDLQRSKNNLIPRIIILLKLIDKSSNIFLNSNTNSNASNLNNLNIAKILKDLKFDNKTINSTILLFEYRVKDFSKIQEKDLRIILSKIGKENLENFSEILKSDIYDKFPKHGKSIFNDFKNSLEKILIENHPLTKKDLKINGKDLNALGFHGEIVGKILDKLLLTVLEDPKLNKYEYLEDIVNRYENS